jgi:short-subunit dehydrogenase
MSYYSGKVVWITGASSGIGEALALALAAQGAKLILTARREAELQRVAENCKKLGSPQVLCLAVDLASAFNAAQLTLKVLSEFPQIDILINNSGVSQRAKAMDTSPELDRMFMELNFFSNVSLTKEVLKTMIARKDGQIVVVSSILGDFGLALHSTYAATKHAVNGFYESLREEVEKDGIKVTVISPGFINTNVALNAIDAKGNKHNVQSQAQEKGMKTDVFARKMLKAVAAQKKFKYIGGMELMMVMVHHYFPSLFYALMRRMSKES